MMTSLVLSALLLLIAWAWLRLAKREVSQPIWSTLEIPEVPEAEVPFLSVILTCRNNIRDIVRCVSSLLHQSYPRFEVIVVDEQSNDGSWERLQELQAQEPVPLRLLRTRHSPEEGVERLSARSHGVEVARGSWLLFTETDTYHAPDLLSRAMAYTRARDLALLSIAPRQECRSFWEHVWQPLLFQYMDLLMPMVRVADPTVPDAWASSSFLLIAREAYTEAGGHTGEVPEILRASGLARRVKALEYRVEFVKAMDLLQVRTYRGLRELWEGWSARLYDLLGAHPSRVAIQALGIWGWSVLPFAAMVPAFSFGFWGLDAVQGWWDVVLAVTTILAVVTILQAQSVLRRVHRQNHWYTATLPLGGVCLGAAVISAMVRRAISKDTRWKDREYRTQKR